MLFWYQGHEKHSQSYGKEVITLKSILNKATGKTILGAIVTVAGIITTIDQLVTGKKQEKEFEALKKAVADLQQKN